jgi:spore germination cell wall hydrolase CwlJ-like protein
MPDRSFLSLALLLLLVASCVPAAGAQLRPDQAAASSLHRASLTGGARPSFGATEEPPPPEILAEEIAPGGEARPFDIGDTAHDDVLSALDCLTAAVYYEARSESEDGQRAVAQVVLNRVRHPAFPKSVCGVVYQGSNRTTGCQFSFTCDGSLAHGREQHAWARSRKIAAAALAGYVYGPVGLATHYHTTAIHPWWADSMSRAVTIGAHIFYRWRGEWGDPKAFQRPYVGNEAMAAADAAGQAAQPAESTEVVAGVTIHRSTDRATSYASAEGGAMVRIHRMGGSDPAVRVHRGGEGGESPALASADAPHAEPAAAGEDPVPVR